MFAGPIFSRETLTTPRQLKHFLMRSGYIAALLVLMYTAGQATYGWQQVRGVGDVARFGSLLFQILSLIQLTLVLFFALLFAAGNVAQEKDRRTLILLLMTDMRDRELVLGKLTASLLIVAVLIVASIPAFLFVHFLGGVSLDQIGWSIALCASTALMAGSWGSLVAYWREKTFQTLAISVIGAVLFIGAIEAIVGLSGNQSQLGSVVGLLNPYRALMVVLSPLSQQPFEAVAKVSGLNSVLAMLLLAVVLNVTAILRLRVWNPTRSVFEAISRKEKEEGAEQKRKARTRNIWANPVIWREICTRAYGRKVFVIKLAYLLLAVFLGFNFITSADDSSLLLGMIPQSGFLFVGLSLLSLMLINAQAVTALTSERDAKTLELFLMTDVTAKEFILGKMGGILYNTKELILIPSAFAVYFAVIGILTVENLVYLLVGLGVLVIFAAMLGIHSGLSFENSRSAIANSLGTIFFLFIGIFIFMILLVEARSSFYLQLQSFVVFIGVGSIGLYASLSHKNPSSAFRIAALGLPFLTFYAITEFLLDGSLGVCFSICVAYGFTTLAMLIPAVSEYDVALGRSTLDKA